MMVTQQIPTMTKSHHGGNLSLMAMVGFCHQHIPTMVIHNDEAGLLIYTLRGFQIHNPFQIQNIFIHNTCIYQQYIS